MIFASLPLPPPPAVPFPLAGVMMAPSADNGLTGQLVMFAAMIGIFYFVVFAPQKKQRRQHEESLRSLKRGDEVVTAGGIVGEVLHIAARDGMRDKDGQPIRSMDDRITIRSGESRLIVERGRIARVGGKTAESTAAT